MAAGTVTRAQLRGPRYRTPFRDVYVEADSPDTYTHRCEAGFLTVRGAGALAGYAAAEMLGAECAPERAAVEVVVPGGNRRMRTGLVVHRTTVSEDEITRAVPVRIRDRRGRRQVVHGRTVDTTSPLRTAFDLARREPRIEAVAALDALGCRCGVDPAGILDVAARHPGVRGIGRLADLVALADPRAESPMETRVRLALVDGDLPPPDLQFPVGPYRLDLAYPAVLLAIEYDGEHHRTPEQARYDLERQSYLDARGWTVVRPSARDVLVAPDALADRVRRELAFARITASR